MSVTGNDAEDAKIALSKLEQAERAFVDAWLALPEDHPLSTRFCGVRKRIENLARDLKKTL